MRPQVNSKKCYADPRICTVLNVCPFNAISFIEKEDLPLGGEIIFDYEKCQGCGICAEICCGQAIDMKE